MLICWLFFTLFMCASRPNQIFLFPGSIMSGSRAARGDLSSPLSPLANFNVADHVRNARNSVRINETSTSNEILRRVFTLFFFHRHYLFSIQNNRWYFQDVSEKTARARACVFVSEDPERIAWRPSSVHCNTIRCTPYVRVWFYLITVNCYRRR